MKSELVRSAEDYEDAAKRLRHLRDEQFPVNSAVRVNGKAEGIVVRQSECPPNLVPVRFLNGNVWWKHVRECERIGWHQAQPMVRVMRLRMAGIKVGTKGDVG